MHRIIRRSEWGAVHDDGAGAAPLPAKEVWLHHSVTIAPDVVPPFEDDYEAIRKLERIGESRFGRGISYTFLVTPVGLIFEGHSVDRIGSHTAGRNTVARAICFVGNYEDARPTEAQIDAAAWLLAHGFLAGWWDAVPLTGGHRDLKATACPGRHAYAAIPEINRRAKALVDAIPTDEELNVLGFVLDLYELCLGKTRAQVMADLALRRKVMEWTWRLTEGIDGLTPAQFRRDMDTLGRQNGRL